MGRGDKICYEMIRKLGYPIESVFDAEDLESQVSESSTMYRDDSGFGNEGSVEDYKKMFELVGESIFVIRFDLSKDSNVKSFVRKHNFNTTYGYENIEEGKPLSVLDELPEIKNIIQEECIRIGINFSDAIVLFLSSGKKLKAYQDRSPLFLLHDFAHAAEGNDANISAKRGGFELMELISEEYENMYANKSGYRLKITDYKNVLNIVTKIDVGDGHILDFENHIFAMSLSGLKGYMNVPETIMPGSKHVYYYSNAKTREAAAEDLEQKIKTFCEEIMSLLKGKVLFSII
jgi:hypothetical protein